MIPLPESLMRRPSSHNDSSLSKPPSTRPSCRKQLDFGPLRAGQVGDHSRTCGVEPFLSLWEVLALFRRRVSFVVVRRGDNEEEEGKLENKCGEEGGISKRVTLLRNESPPRHMHLY